MSVPGTLAVDPIAADVERAAHEILPLLGQAENRVLREQYAIAFANILGNVGEFCGFVSGSRGERLVRIERLLHAFRENVELLIRKTWVEKQDARRKDKVHEDLEVFVQEFQSGLVRKAFPHFVDLSQDIARLLFGAQAQAPDFLEYAFRIDPKLGIFYWYVGELGKQTFSDGGEELWTLELLLGIYALATF
ncbi:MAG TPA: hypothetical protein VLH39_05305 [Magnetospirillaceae bacterium]|nr:hypothetical protein [Magnetospirillaceae bacterium]